MLYLKQCETRQRRMVKRRRKTEEKKGSKGTHENI
jgi:hypothetical protein